MGFLGDSLIQNKLQGAPRISYSAKIYHMKLFKTGFPVRFKTNEIPSLGIMEIKSNDTWKRLCTPSWDDKERDLTCRAMGYNGPTDNSTHQPESKSHSNTTIRQNCTSLFFSCNNNSKENLQSCAGSLCGFVNGLFTLLIFFKVFHFL